MLNENQLAIRETVRQFARKELAPGAAKRDRDATFPKDAFRRMGELGLLGMLVSEENGGAASDSVSYALAAIEIAAADGAASTAFQVHNALVNVPIERFGTGEQRKRFLQPLACGQWLGCFCLTEPDAGSDPAAVKTTARRRGNRFVINGAKQFITAGRSADVALVFASTNPDAGGKGISALLVPTDTPGYHVARVEETLGQRSTDHCHIVFDGCEVGPDNLLGEEGEGLKIALSSLQVGRIGVAAQSVGMARSAYDAALAYAKERRSFGKPIIEHQAVAFRLADMATSLHAAELMVWRAASLRDQGKPFLKEASMAKLYASEAAERICRDAIQTLGGYGYLADFPVERIYRDVRVCTIYEGTSDIQRLVIGREIGREQVFQGLN
jgi:butyryl-CoA dehydrogenase